MRSVTNLFPPTKDDLLGDKVANNFSFKTLFIVRPTILWNYRDYFFQIEYFEGREKDVCFFSRGKFGSRDRRVYLILFCILCVCVIVEGMAREVIALTGIQP